MFTATSEARTKAVFDGNRKIIFSCLYIKTYVVGTHSKRLVEAILMSTHNIGFKEEMSKIIPKLSHNYLQIISVRHNN